MNNAAALAVGHLLDGRYRIHKVLGTGGMGRVYLANDTRLANRPVAAKEMIIGDGIEERKAIADFSREASVLARLSHPSIPQVIDYFAEQGRHYLVMEFVAGGDLQHRLDEMGAAARLPEAEVLRMARQLLDVLQFLHSQKPPIVYRDLKPGNIMIDQHGRAMLIDFGIARFLPPGGRGTQIGSIGYAPPEQYLGKMEPRSDLYALGATMHHLLTGRDPQLEPPFSFPPVRQLALNVSAKTADIIMAALDQDMSRRPQSAREMKDFLPNPEMDQAQGSVYRGGPSTGPKPGIGSMATIVLNQPVVPSRSATPPSPVSSASRSSSARSAPQVKTQRRLTLSSPAKVPVPPSSTAKTADLNLKKPEKISAPVNPALAPVRINDTKQPAAPAASRSRVAAALASVRTAISSSSSSSPARPDSGGSQSPGATIK
ncbi:MAG: serine/threonine protein kinase, partial [Deltaproteobacteria bacterium]|nr:serine/threonine protein kinase [Deltaproteobacteria bacterium]